LVPEGKKAKHSIEATIPDIDMASQSDEQLLAIIKQQEAAMEALAQRKSDIREAGVVGAPAGCIDSSIFWPCFPSGFRARLRQAKKAFS
jgi:2-hydroxychromene-2-carboxylate isomerase